MSETRSVGRSLASYRPQHDHGCAVHYCGWQWHNENGSGVCRLPSSCDIHYRATPDSHDFVEQSCTCGLDAALQRDAALRDAPQRELIEAAIEYRFGALIDGSLEHYAAKEAKKVLRRAIRDTREHPCSPAEVVTPASSAPSSDPVKA